jgi:rhodanese-related sulfurtransferase
MGSFKISPRDLFHRLGLGRAPIIVDVRREPIFSLAGQVIPAACWRDHMATDTWGAEIPAGADVVAYCIHGHNVSQLATAHLRARGIQAFTLDGGIEAWTGAGYPVVGKSAFAPPEASDPSVWVTRTNPKIDRIACPWFIRRFVDRRARFLFVDPDQVLPVADELEATAFDIEGAPIAHHGERCSFDDLLDHFAVSDAALRHMAEIVRGADTARPDLAREAAGLLAVSLGISALSPSDQDALERGFPVYDALYAWANFARGEPHDRPAARR